MRYGRYFKTEILVHFEWIENAQNISCFKKPSRDNFLSNVVCTRSRTGRFTGAHPDQMFHITYGFSQKIRMDEFSSETACVTTRKMKISEKILDEFSMICQ